MTRIIQSHQAEHDTGECFCSYPMGTPDEARGDAVYVGRDALKNYVVHVENGDDHLFARAAEAKAFVKTWNAG
jgi:hypothetical protein